MKDNKVEIQASERGLRAAIGLFEGIDPEYSTKVVDALAELAIGSRIEIGQLLDENKCEFQEGEEK